MNANSLFEFIARVKAMNTIRIAFLVLGVLMIFGGIDRSDLFLGLLGVYFTLKSYYNWGCAGAVCNTRMTNPSNDELNNCSSKQ